jgi:hypothetical protein
VLSGSSDPSDLNDGEDGDFYINTTTRVMFGPKASGEWPAGVPIGAATDPSTSVTTLGAASEGSETAATDTWTSGGDNGLAEWYVSRVVYNDGAATPTLYAFLRKRTYDKYGRLYAVSAETRITVDVPE